MTGFAIYMEGGGDSQQNKATLRRGMSAFLRSLSEEARRNQLHWKIIACGSRNEAFSKFQRAAANEPETFNVLLVDAEDGVTRGPAAHLARRDGCPHCERLFATLSSRM